MIGKYLYLVLQYRRVLITLIAGANFPSEVGREVPHQSDIAFGSSSSTECPPILHKTLVRKLRSLWIEFVSNRLTPTCNRIIS